MKKNLFKSKKNLSNFSLLLCSCCLLFFSCSTEEISLEENNENDFASKSKNSVNLNIVDMWSNRAQEGNGPDNARDKNMSTRWSAYGKGSRLVVKLGAKSLVDYIQIAFHKGDTRKNYFKVQVRENNTGSWKEIKSKTSSGTTSGFELFDLPNTNVQYLRIIGNGTNDGGLWNSISELQVWGTGSQTTPTPTPTPPSNGNTPGSNIGLTSNTWKLNGFRGTGSGATYEDDLLKAINKNYGNYSDPNYFYKSGDWSYFKCYRGLGGSSNSSNPRVELREMNNGKLANWNGNNGTHTMEWTVRVDQLPKSTSGKDGVVCFGQIHGPEKNSAGEEIDDAIRVQFRGQPNQKSGNVKLKISGYVTEEQGGSVTLDTNYKLDTSYNFKIVYAAKVIKVFVNNSEVFSRKMDIKSWDGNYFKAGNYLQSVKGASYDSSSFGLVGIRSLKVTHN